MLCMWLKRQNLYSFSQFWIPEQVSAAFNRSLNFNMLFSRPYTGLHSHFRVVVVAAEKRDYALLLWGTISSRSLGPGGMQLFSTTSMLRTVMHFPSAVHIRSWQMQNNIRNANVLEGACTLSDTAGKILPLCIWLRDQRDVQIRVVISDTHHK